MFVILSKGKEDKVRKVLEALNEFKVKRSSIEGCLSALALGEADEIIKVLKTLEENGINREIIDSNLNPIARGKSSEMQEIFDRFQKHGIIGANVVKRGIRLLVEGKADDIERIIVILKDNGVRNEIIEEELSVIVNSRTPEEVEDMFNDSKEPEDIEEHYANVRRYMKLKELYGRVYKREEIEALCDKKHLTVKEFIMEIVTYPGGREFTDIYYEKLMTEGTLYVGGTTNIDREYQEEHVEELIQLSKRIANTFALRTMNKDRSELQSIALEIMLAKCGNLVYNLSHRPTELMATMFNKTIGYLYSAMRKSERNYSLTEYEKGKGTAGQIDIPVEDNVQGFEEKRLEDSIDYEKAQFDETETQVMHCMIKLIEERRGR